MIKRITSLFMVLMISCSVFVLCQPIEVKATSYVVDARSQTFQYYTKDNVKDNVTYRIPRILLNSDDAKSANNEIQNRYDNAFKTANESKDYVTKLDYKYYVNKNILSVIIYYLYPRTCGVEEYLVYNFNIKTGHKLSDKEFAEEASLDYSNMKKALSLSIRESYEKEKSEYGDTYYMYIYEPGFANTISESNLNKASFYFGENGSLKVVCDLFYYQLGGKVRVFTITLTSNLYSSGIRLYSDHTNLNVKIDDTITIAAEIVTNGKTVYDKSKLTFSIYDTSIITVQKTKFEDDCLKVLIKPQKVGTTYITFSDSKTGYVTRVPITVFNSDTMSYTVDNIPTIKNGKYEYNFYNISGITIDNYKLKKYSNGTCDVSFDVYNSNSIYGVVEIYNENGTLSNAKIIDKMTNNIDSLKTTVDKTCGLIKDVVVGDVLSYKGSTVSAKTSINVTIPKGGSIKITTDTDNSILTAIINSVDMFMKTKEIAGEISNYTSVEDAFTKQLTKNILNNKIKSTIVNDSEKFKGKLLVNIAKNLTIFGNKSAAEISDTVLCNLNGLEFEKIIVNTIVEYGWDVGESLFKYFSGPIGKVLGGTFTMAKTVNLMLSWREFVMLSNSNSLVIQNQEGNIRTDYSVTVKSDTNFDNQTALKVFKVTTNDSSLSFVKNQNPELYEKMSSTLTSTYNISMIKNGVENQLQDWVEVSIPIPENISSYAYKNLVSVYRVEDNGKLTKMNTTIKNNCLVFRTNHFSVYSLMPPESAYVTVTLNKKSDVMGVGQRIFLAAQKSSEKFELKNKWTTSNKNIAYVDSNGMVTANNVGQAIITVALDNGNKDSCKIVVKKAPTSVKIEKSNYVLRVGEIVILNAELPDGCASSLVWSSNSQNVASVTSNGKLTAKGVGVATLTVRTYNGKTATCKVTVTSTLPTPSVSSLTNTASGIKLSWNKVSSAYGYRVYQKTSNGWKRIKDTTATSYTDSAVSVNQTKTYTMRCIDKNGNTVSGYNSKGWSKKYTPVAPTISKLENTSGGIKLSWNKIAGVYGYRLYYKTSSGGWKRFKDTTATSFTDSGVSPNRTETYTIRCIDKNGNTVSGFNSKGWSKKYTPVAPTISKLENTSSGVKLSWNKIAGVYGYRLYYKTSSGGWKRFKDTTATSFTDSGVSPNRTETYTIRCIDKNGNTVSGYNSKGWSKKYAPVAPKITKLTNTSKGVSATWNKVAGVYGYRLYRKYAGGSWTKVKDTTSISFTDSGAKKGKKVTYTVRCIDKKGKTISGYNATGWSITRK